MGDESPRSSRPPRPGRVSAWACATTSRRPANRLSEIMRERDSSVTTIMIPSPSASSGAPPRQSTSGNLPVGGRDSADPGHPAGIGRQPVPVRISGAARTLRRHPPRARSAVFLCGAAVCLLTVGFIVVFVLRDAGLNKSGNSTLRYGLQFGLGVAFLVGSWALAHRPPKSKPAEAQPSRVTRAVSSSGLLAVFVVGSQCTHLRPPIWRLSTPSLTPS